MSFLKKYTTIAYATRLLILFVDILMTYVSFYVANLLRHNFEYGNIVPSFSMTLLFILLVRLVTFKVFKTYSVIIRFVGVSDLIKIFYAITVGSIFFVSFYLSSLPKYLGISLSLSVLLIDYILLIFMLSGSRLLMRLLHKIFFLESKNMTNVILIGAGNLGAMTAKLIKEDTDNNYHINAIFDDDPNVHLKSLDGILTYNTRWLSTIVKQQNVEKAIVAIQNISIKRKNEFVNLCLENGLKVLQVPSSSKWLNGNFEVKEIKEIKVENLLERAPIVLDKQDIKQDLFDKIILITGGAGSIGSELVRQIIKFEPKELIVIDQAETPLVNLGLAIKEEYKFDRLIPIIGDVTDKNRIESIFKKYRPQIIFHAAAYKHVPIMESFPREAINVNIHGTKIMADLSHKYEVNKFVMVSTDKAVNPTNVMGASKRIAEMYIQSLNRESTTQFITTRFGNVLGSNGSVIPRFKKQIEKGGPLTVTHPNITRYFMTIPEASQLVLEAGTMGDGGEIFLFDMGEPVKILDLAEKLIRLSGFKPYNDIDIVFSGLRPGEKLTEELLTNKENSVPTHHPKITKAKVQEFEYGQIDEAISRLILSLGKVDNMCIVTQMKHIVPEYISNNSIFNVIDENSNLAIK